MPPLFECRKKRTEKGVASYIAYRPASSSGLCAERKIPKRGIKRGTRPGGCSPAFREPARPREKPIARNAWSSVFRIRVAGVLADIECCQSAASGPAGCCGMVRTCTQSASLGCRGECSGSSPGVSASGNCDAPRHATLLLVPCPRTGALSPSPRATRNASQARSATVARDHDGTYLGMATQ
jgi:hypothetical protein